MKIEKPGKELSRKKLLNFCHSLNFNILEYRDRKIYENSLFDGIEEHNKIYENDIITQYCSNTFRLQLKFKD